MRKEQLPERRVLGIQGIQEGSVVGRDLGATKDNGCHRVVYALFAKTPLLLFEKAQLFFALILEEINLDRGDLLLEK